MGQTICLAHFISHFRLPSIGKCLRERFQTDRSTFRDSPIASTLLSPRAIKKDAMPAPLSVDSWLRMVEAVGAGEYIAWSCSGLG